MGARERIAYGIPDVASRAGRGCAPAPPLIRLHGAQRRDVDGMAAAARRADL